MEKGGKLKMNYYEALFLAVRSKKKAAGPPRTPKKPPTMPTTPHPSPPKPPPGAKKQG
jgi:hypothetical protein